MSTVPEIERAMNTFDLDVTPTLSEYSDIDVSDDDNEKREQNLANHNDAQEEWEQNLAEIQLIFGHFLIPLMARFLGQKCAYWGWARFMEWKYPVSVSVESKAEFITSGVIGSALL